MIDHQTYFSQLLMPVFPIEILSRVPSSSWPTWRGAATQCRSVQADFFPFPWGSPWISPWIFTDEHEIFQLDILHLHWWFIHWMFIGWFTIPWRMVYHPLEDGLRKIGWFTVIIDEPLNWMVYTTFLSLVPPSAWRRCGAFRGSRPLFEQSLEVGSNKNIKKHIGSTTRN